jgi:hypothetical protein
LGSSTVSAITPTKSEHNPWDQLPEESTKSFHAFAIFRDMGWERSIGKVVNQCRKSPSLIYRWSAAYRWSERAQEWDAFQDQLGQAQAVRTRMEMNKVTLTIAQTMQTKAMDGYLALETVRPVKFTDEKGEKKEKLILAIKPSDLMRLVESAHKLQKSVLGKSDEDHVAKIELHFGPREDFEENEMLDGGFSGPEDDGKNGKS